MSMLTNIRTMSWVKILVILAIISSSHSETTEFNTTPDTVNSELDSIFDVKGDDENSLENKKNVVCNTKECQILAKELSRGMNRSINPCDNFYDFVCGTWEDEISIPEYEPMWNRFFSLQNVVHKRIKEIMETEPLPTDIIPVRQAKKWYRSCLDIEALEHRSIQPIEAVLLQVGGWPMTLDPEEWDESEHSWNTVEHDYFHITGSYVFYRVSRAFDDDFAITLEKGFNPLPKRLSRKYRNYDNDDYETYAEIIEAVTEMFVEYNKAAVTDEMIKKDVADLVEFERELYLLGRSIKEYDYDRWTLTEFVQWYNSNITEIKIDGEIQKIDFESLIRRKYDLVNRKIEDSDYVYVDYAPYYIQLTELLNKVPTRTIVNYIHWHFVSSMLEYTIEEMRDAFFLLMKNKYDVKRRKPRWLECLEEMKMEVAMGYAFVTEHFSPEAEEAALEMIENVRAETADQIGASNWMDEETKRIAKEKLGNMSVILGFPEWYKNETVVRNFYKGLAIGYSHFDNILSFRKYEIKMSLLSSMGQQFSLSMLSEVDPITVNAYYSPFENTVVLPAADFQPPIFTARIPPSVSYGILGLAVAHEIGHGYDPDGIQIGASGEKTEISEEMLSLYNNQSECFVGQFNQYYGVTESPNSYVQSRGRKTRPDNMADSTGLHSVYKAFRKLIDKHSIENYQLPGFEDYTDDQMFYISFASMWCEAVTDKYSEEVEKSDPHSPGRLRVIGSISNTKDFGEAFNCPIGSPMNPVNKCNLWQAPL